ncbi:DUF6056 family protein [Paraflavitalea sp. CAU 1676]|uniref:DUF6056 family protein n=1 Tax=Paraflavitalea sp. CAU 1676 TaxID=3032598 RepID=UPI0023DB1419|nr:DUF6056 family protein [Paraflavitalea sp. CAU 1676]MDF2189781.1 DUF6056 family protein [Paraflavitalea sp. CAU 1676]
MKRLTWIVGLLLFTFLILIAWLCFFQFPSMDDYAGTYLKKVYGLGGAIKWYLKESNGRFTSIPVFLTISSSKTLLGAYGWLLLGTLIIAFSCVFFFVRMIGRHLFEPVLSGWMAALIAAMILLVFLEVVPEISSFIYWMATGVTYLLPFAFFLLLTCAYSCLLKAAGKRRWMWTLVVGVATCLLAGCNEVMLYYVCALPFLIGISILAMGKPLPVQIGALAGLSILVVLAVLQLPGNMARAGHYVQKQSLLESAAGAAYRTWQTLLNIFTSPLFYVSCLGIVIASAYLKANVLAYWTTKRNFWMVQVACLAAMIFCFDVVIRQVGNEVIPPRAINIMVCLTVVGCWWIILLNAARIRQLMDTLLLNRVLMMRAFLFIFCIALTGSGFAWQLMKNLVEAPLHAAILKQREADILREKAAGNKVVVIKTYQKEAERIAREKYGNKHRFILEEFAMPPSFSYFKDEPNKKELAYFYAEYHGVDTLIGAEGKFARWGLIDDRLK